MIEDSMGNLLPNSVHLDSDFSKEELERALSIDNFNLAALKALDAGYNVIYDEARKNATIKDKNRIIDFIQHL